MNHQHAVVPFQFETHEIRTIKDEKNEPWFVAKDICDVLGLENVTNAIRSIPEKHKGVNLIKTLGGKQTVNIISEPGLYRLVLRSDKPQAEPFMDWVTEEVLPSIRKRGFYGNLNKEGVKTLVADVAAEVVAVLQARQQKGPFVDTTGVKGFLAWLDHDLKGKAYFLCVSRSRSNSPMARPILLPTRSQVFLVRSCGLSSGI